MGLRGGKSPAFFRDPPGLWAFSLLRLLLHYPRPDEKRDPGEPRNLPCRISQDAEEPFYELPESLTRAVLCMLLSLMLLACEEGGKVPRVPPVRAKS